MNIGDAVQILGTGDPNRDLMYRGWFGVVLQVRPGEAFVDSDAYTRRTGTLQAVSFRRWFPIRELAAAAAAAPAPAAEGGKAP